MENSKLVGIDEPEDREEKEEEDEDEEEEKKMEMFFALIRNYQEARKREREAKGKYACEEIRNPKKRYVTSDGGGRGGIVPTFRPEDFARNSETDFPAKDEERKSKHVDEEDEEEEEEEEKKANKKDVGLDLNLAL